MRRLLLDTHALLWALSDVAKLTSEAAALLKDRSGEVFISAASVWEIAIKRNQGKLRVPADFVKSAIERGFTALPISLIHAETAGALPLLHRDPFDRMLVAQAKVEGLTLMSDDPRTGSCAPSTEGLETASPTQEKLLLSETSQSK